MPAYPLRAAFAGVLLFVTGLAMAGGVWQVARQESLLLQGWLRADGTVVELLKRRTIDGDVQVPLIAFTTSAGDRISFTAPPNRNAAAYVTGPVKVLYHPDHPQDAVIDSTGRRRLRNGLAGVAALVLICLGGYVAWYASRWDGTASGPAA